MLVGMSESPPGPDAAGFWQERYGERDRLWSGRPNVALVATVGGLAPGRVLELGCGEGADSIWLAEQGWRVTAVDVAETAIARGRSEAAARGIADGRITWLIADLASWSPPGSYELVSACFLHSPIEFPREGVLRRAAQAVRPGGHLLVVGHAEPPPWADEHAHDPHHFLGPDEELAALALDPAEWAVVVSDLRSREASGPDGQPATLRDGVLLLRRRTPI